MSIRGCMLSIVLEVVKLWMFKIFETQVVAGNDDAGEMIDCLLATVRSRDGNDGDGD